MLRREAGGKAEQGGRYVRSLQLAGQGLSGVTSAYRTEVAAHDRRRLLGRDIGLYVGLPA